MKKGIAIILAAAISIIPVTTAFAGVDDAYFFGCVDDDLDTSTEMENVEYWIDKMGYYTKIYTNPSISRFSDSRLNSSVLYFAGHGNKYSLNTGDDVGICNDGRNDYKDISDSNFSRTEMAIMAACKTGRYNNDPSECLAGTIEDNGANFVLAWTSSPNSGILADYTDSFARYVRKGNTYFDAVTKTENLLLNEGVIEDNPVFDVILFGRINDTLPEVSDDANSLAIKVSKNPVAAYLDEELNQKIVDKEVTYKAASHNYDEIEQYIKENVDADFSLENYNVKDFSKENGVDLISFRLKVDGISSNYGFTALCLDDELKLITFSNNYNNTSSENILSAASLSTNSIATDYTDNELLEMAINADGFSYNVDEQYIEKYYDITEGKVVYNVNTVYEDNSGAYFCTVHKF